MPPSASSPLRKRFDYDSLDATDAVFIQQQTGAIQSLMKRSAQDIVEIGQRLIEIKKRLGHGRFGSWLDAEFNWDERTARRFMSVADKFGKTDNLSETSLAPSALYLLATASTPEPARAEAIARAQSGEPISYTTAKSIKQRYAPRKESPTAAPAASAQPELKQEQSSVPPQAVTPVEESASLTPRVETPRPQAQQSPKSEDIASQSPSSSPSSASTTPLPAPVSTPSVPQQPVVSRSSAPPQLTPRQRATEQTRPQPEILAIRPKEVDLGVSEPDRVETATAPAKGKPRFAQTGAWWQFEETHLLYCGDPGSPRFRERLPERIALSLAFPPNRAAWPQPPEGNTGSSLALHTRFQEDQDFQVFREMIERSLSLYTEGNDVVVIQYLVDPEILNLAHNLECRWFCAEPDLLKCDQAIATWKEKGYRVEKMSGLRF